MKTDITYTTDGFTVRIFPNNPQAEEVWNTIAAHPATSNGVIPSYMWPSIRKQIKDAGYSVRKLSSRSQRGVASDDSLLSDLSE